ncbi:MAG: N-(5'-phosphoribosyl)anthranilate isomerase, partial [Desulfobacteria bacterium]
MTKIKICGITNIEDAIWATNLGADALGFVFYKDSPRCIRKDTAKEIIRRLPPFVSSVGVFVNEKEDRVREISSDCRLDILQFHGNESPDFCSHF